MQGRQNQKHVLKLGMHWQKKNVFSTNEMMMKGLFQVEHPKNGNTVEKVPNEHSLAN